MARDFEVTVVNPTENPRGRRRRRRSTTPRRRRRRRAAPRENPGFALATRRRSPARRNPSFMGLNFGIGGVLSNAALRLLGKVIGAAAVRTIGTAEENQISGGNSPTTGMRWSFWNHFVCVGAGLLAGGLLGRWRAGAGQHIFEGALDLSLQKMFWSEMVHRTEAGPKWLGAADEGDVLEDSRTGKTWIRQGGKWVAMLGLQEKTALDGLEYATALGRAPRRHGRRREPMGHLLPSDYTNSDADYTGRYTNSASSDPYSAAYQR